MPTTAVGSRESLYHRFERIEQRIVECGIDADQFALIAGVASDESGDVLFGIRVEDLAEGEEVFLADAQGELAHGIAEQAREVSFQIAQRVDAESVDIEAGDHVLIGADQEALQIGVCCHHLLEDAEVADSVVAVAIGNALAAEELVLLQF